MSATIHIPVALITTPLKVLFRILTIVLATTILATGIGAAVAAMTGRL